MFQHQSHYSRRIAINLNKGRLHFQESALALIIGYQNLLDKHLCRLFAIANDVQTSLQTIRLTTLRVIVACVGAIGQAVQTIHCRDVIVHTDIELALTIAREDVGAEALDLNHLGTLAVLQIAYVPEVVVGDDVSFIIRDLHLLERAAHLSRSVL